MPPENDAKRDVLFFQEEKGLLTLIFVIGCASGKFSTTACPAPPFCWAEFVKIAIPSKYPAKMWRWQPEGHHLNKQGAKTQQV